MSAAAAKRRRVAKRWGEDFELAGDDSDSEGQQDGGSGGGGGGHAGGASRRRRRAASDDDNDASGADEAASDDSSSGGGSDDDDADDGGSGGEDSDASDASDEEDGEPACTQARGDSGAAAAAAAAAAGGGRGTGRGSSRKKNGGQQQQQGASKPKKGKAAAAAAAAAAAPARRRVGLRVGASKARKICVLDSMDLHQLKDVRTSHNPWFGYTRMYSSVELEEYARKKHAGKVWFERHLAAALSSVEAKRQRRRQDRETDKAAALAAVRQYATRGTALATEQYGDTNLPDEVLTQIMQCLAATREPGGLRGFACVARDLASASLASWDFHRAAKEGFAALAHEARTTPHPPQPRGVRYKHLSGVPRWDAGHLQGLPGPPELGGWEFWEAFLREPLRPTAAKLQQAVRTVALQAKGTKPEMARKLLGAFGLKAATWAPGQLLRVVRMEKHRRIAWDGPSCDELSKSVDSAICQLVQADKEAWADLAAARSKSVAAIHAAIRTRFSSIGEFVAAAAAAHKQRLQREAAERVAAKAAADAAKRARHAAAAAAPAAAPAPVAPAAPVSQAAAVPAVFAPALLAHAPLPLLANGYPGLTWQLAMLMLAMQSRARAALGGDEDDEL